MSLLKFFWNKTPPATDGKSDDPLSHPDISAMSQRQIADLPLGLPAPKPTRHELSRVPHTA